MSQKFIHGVVPDAAAEPDALATIADAKKGFEVAMADYRLNVSQARPGISELVRFLNKYIDTRAPWALAKANDPALAGVMRSMLLCLRSAEGLIRPVLPNAADAIAEQLGLPRSQASTRSETLHTSLPAGTKLQAPPPDLSTRRIDEVRSSTAQTR